jgi:hypothetical protein
MCRRICTAVARRAAAGRIAAGSSERRHAGRPVTADRSLGSGRHWRNAAPALPPVPMPQPRPAGAPTAPAGPAATTGAPLNITPPAPNPDSSPAAPPIKPASTSSFKFGGQTALGRSLGIDPNSNGFKSAMAGLGEGLTAAGNSKGKSAGAAFGAGAGGALTGATKQDNTQYDQRLKSLQLAVNAQQVGDKSAFNKNMAEY